MAIERKYPSAELSTDQRELIARLAGTLEGHGISRSTFRNYLDESGFTISKPSLDRWILAHRLTGSIFTAEKASGAPPLLDEEQCEIAAGWVLSQNDLNQAVSLVSFSEFCKFAFSIDVATSTAHNYLHYLGFSSKVSQLKTSGYIVDVETLSKLMFEWKLERKQAGDLKGLIASADFTFTGHRTDRRVSYAPTGGAQPKSSIACSQFTNCIVTVVWSDGVNRTPPAIFTYNGKFRLDRVVGLRENATGRVLRLPTTTGRGSRSAADIWFVELGSASFWRSRFAPVATRLLRKARRESKIADRSRPQFFEFGRGTRKSPFF